MLWFLKKFPGVFRGTAKVRIMLIHLVDKSWIYPFCQKQRVEIQEFEKSNF
jgi:hypothetical protein